MLRTAARVMIALSMAIPISATAEPVKLKLAFFSSDRSVSYRAAVRPFVDAMDEKASGLVEIEPYFSGTLGKELPLQADLVANGTADIAYVVAGLTRNRFHDNSIIEMPGLYRNMREATLVLTRLIAADMMKGFEDFFVIGAYVTEPESIHSRTPINSLDDIKGKKIRVNNPGQAAALEKLGAIPVLMPVNQIAVALGSGSIDAALVNPSPLNDFGIKRVATHHFMLQTAGAPLLVVMNRKKFESLPGAAKELIRNHSGEWAAQHFISTFEPIERVIMEELQADPKRKVVFPTASDLQKAQRAFRAVKQEWAAASPRNRALLERAELELAKLRAPDGKATQGSSALER